MAIHRIIQNLTNLFTLEKQKSIGKKNFFSTVTAFSSQKGLLVTSKMSRKELSLLATNFPQGWQTNFISFKAKHLVEGKDS